DGSFLPSPRARWQNAGPVPDRSPTRLQRALRRPGRAYRLRAKAAAFQVPGARWASWPTSFHAGLLEKLGQVLARIEHARLHGVLRDRDDLGDFLDRLLVVVHKIDDLPVVGRELGQTLAQDFTRILLLQRDVRSISAILDRLCLLLIQLRFFSAAHRRK